MIGCNKSTMFVVFAIAMVIGNTTQAGSAYNITELGSLGGSLTVPEAINANGLTVGVAQNSSGLWQAVSWKANSTTPISLGDGLVTSQAVGVNDNGIVVGSSNGNAAFWQPGSTTPNYLTTSGNGLAYDINSIGQIVGIDNGNAVLWQPGSTTPILLEIDAVATDINDNGQIVGAVFSSTTRGALWQPNSTPPFTIQVLTGGGGEAIAINNNGQIVGNYGNATLWQTGSSTTISLYGDIARSINNNGEIVGTVWGGAGYYAALWESNSTIPESLNSLVTLPNSHLEDALGINDSGQIVALSASGQAYLLTPVSSVPIPASIWLFASALVGFIGFNRRKNIQQ